MLGRRGSATPRPRRPARSMLVTPRWPVPTRTESRSARKRLGAQAVTKGGRGGSPAALFLRPFEQCAYSCMPAKPSLRTELLVNLAFLATAALLLGVGTVIAVQALVPDLSPGQALPLIFGIVALDVGIFIVFGSYLVRRHILRPLGRVIDVADAVAAGDLAARAPGAETRDFAVLAERLNRMTDHLLDAQGQLVRSEKLASVGRLAAGVAHEVGNPLGAIGTYLEVLRRRGADPEVMAGLARELERIDTIVRSLLDYARPREEALQPVSVEVVVRAAYQLLHAQGALKAAEASLDLSADGLPRILGRAHALEQALVNLLLNAVDAARRGVDEIGGLIWVTQAREGGAAFKMFFPSA